MINFLSWKISFFALLKLETWRGNWKTTCFKKNGRIFWCGLMCKWLHSLRHFCVVHRCLKICYSGKYTRFVLRNFECQSSWWLIFSKLSMLLDSFGVLSYQNWKGCKDLFTRQYWTQCHASLGLSNLPCRRYYHHCHHFRWDPSSPGVRPEQSSSYTKAHHLGPNRQGSQGIVFLIQA